MPERSVSRRQFLRVGLVSAVMSLGSTLACTRETKKTASLPENKTASTETEAQRLGRLMEQFHLDIPSPIKLNPLSVLKSGNVIVSNSSQEAVALNSAELFKMLAKYGVTSLQSYQMGIEFASYIPSPNPAGAAMSRHFDDEGQISIAKIAIASYTTTGTFYLQNEVSSPQTQANREKRAILKANMDLLENICSLAEIARLQRQRVAGPNAIRLADQKAGQAAQQYLKELLEGKEQLFFSSIQPRSST